MACHTIERRPLELCKELALAGGKSLGVSPSHGRETKPGLTVGRAQRPRISPLAHPQGERVAEVGPCKARLTRRFLTGISLSAIG